MRLIEKKILEDPQIKFLIDKHDYSSAAEYLFKSQLSNWLLMKNNYEMRDKVKTKSFWFDSFKMIVQFNSERIKSTSAKVDDTTIKSRKCFLCLENLPDEQKGILLPDDFILLCNPYPVFPEHFTISSIQHQPQRIFNSINSFLEISSLFPCYCLVYNGPACGASAPDHLHFQAGTKNFIPIENDIQQLKNDFGRIVQDDESVTTSFIDDGLRKIIFIESMDKLEIEKAFHLIYKNYQKLVGVNPEPMMNILSFYHIDFGWYLIIFLRNKHRPECFYKNDPEKILISPAAIDIGGIVVTPREEDYIKIDKSILSQIFNEVSLDKKTFLLLEEAIKKDLS